MTASVKGRLTHDRSRRIESPKDFRSRGDVNDTVERPHSLASIEFALIE